MKFISIDSSLANTGIAMGVIKSDGLIVMSKIILIETEKTKNKQVRASSDTIARCKQTYEFVHTAIERWAPSVIFVETPSGSQSASGMKSYGATCQLIASVTPDPIQVTPTEVKVGSIGNKTASKKDMINWAHNLYPDLEWDKNKDGTLKNKNEHMADAIAIAHAGINTADFNRIKSMFNS